VHRRAKAVTKLIAAPSCDCKQFDEMCLPLLSLNLPVINCIAFSPHTSTSHDREKFKERTYVRLHQPCLANKIIDRIDVKPTTCFLRLCILINVFDRIHVQHFCFKERSPKYYLDKGRGHPSCKSSTVANASDEFYRLLPLLFYGVRHKAAQSQLDSWFSQAWLPFCFKKTVPARSAERLTSTIVSTVTSKGSL
jgi:hypothetical protein